MPHRVRSKSDLARSFRPTAQYDSLSEIDTPPNLDQLRPMSYEEFYASCDAMSSKSSATVPGRDPEEFSSCLVPEEKHGECTADASMVSLEPGIVPGLQPSLPSAAPIGSFANLAFFADPTISPTSAEEPLAGAPETDSVEHAPSNIVPAVPQAANVVRRKLTGYVGFANLPNQWHRKSVRKGFNFNVMVVGKCGVSYSCIRDVCTCGLHTNPTGESGLGKSTLVNTLFNTSLYPPKEQKGPSLDIIPKTVQIQSISADIEEAGVRLRLTVVDTPGFGDFVNNDESWRPIVENIEQRFDAYLDAENKVNRMNIVDNRIHACVFFIQPTGHSLKPLEIEVMRRLHTKVNLIPVIAKADTLTDEEINNFKARVSYGPVH